MSIFPGVRRIGLSFWCLKDGWVKRIALGNDYVSATYRVVDTFRPRAIFIESVREFDVEPSAYMLPDNVQLLRSHPDWRMEDLSAPYFSTGKPHRYSIFAYVMATCELKRFNLFNFDGKPVIQKYTSMWLVNNSPKRYGQ